MNSVHTLITMEIDPRNTSDDMSLGHNNTFGSATYLMTLNHLV